MAASTAAGGGMASTRSRPRASSPAGSAVVTAITAPDRDPAAGPACRRPVPCGNAGKEMPRPLVIVESPTKAKKIAEDLGRDFAVEASIGHIRDLPQGAAEVPAAYKKLPWARLGVDTENDFAPLYIVPT